MKKTAIFLLVLTLLFLFVACDAHSDELQLGGTATFYDVEYRTPELYVFDSTQSKEDFVVYERGWHDKLLLMSRSDVTQDPARLHLEKYANNMKKVGAEYCEFIEFKGGEAVLAKYIADDKNCIEVYFIHGNSKYAIAMRGETEENFNTFINSVELTPLS